MSETTETEAGPAPADGETGTGDHDPTLHQLSEKVDRLAGLVEQFITGNAAQPEAEPPDIKREVREAVREVQTADKAKAAKEEHAQSIEDRIGQVERKLEEAPMEFKRATERMGWAKP